MHPSSLRFGTIRGEDLPITEALVQSPDDTTSSAPDRRRRGQGRAVRIRPEDRATVRLAELGQTPADVDYVVRTHLDRDHASALDQFGQSRIVVQRQKLDAARSSGLLRHQWQRAHRNREKLTYEHVDEDTPLLFGDHTYRQPRSFTGTPVRSDGFAPYRTGPDHRRAIPAAEARDPDTCSTGSHDHDKARIRTNTRKLARIVRERRVKLTVYSHDLPNTEPWYDRHRCTAGEQPKATNPPYKRDFKRNTVTFVERHPAPLNDLTRL